MGDENAIDGSEGAARAEGLVALDLSETSPTDCNPNFRPESDIVSLEKQTKSDLEITISDQTGGEGLPDSQDAEDASDTNNYVSTTPRLPEPLSPEVNLPASQLYSRSRKAAVLALLTIWGFVGNISNTVLQPALPSIQIDLNTTQQAVNASVAVCAVVNGIMPLLWAAVSDLFGRRKVFLVSGPLLVVSSVAGFFTPNIGVFYLIRIVQQTAARASLSTGSGTIADMYGKGQLSNALGIFYLGFTTGTTIGPAIGGVITELSSWRWCFIFTAAFALISWTMTALFLPETGTLPPSSCKPTLTQLLRKPLHSLSYNRYPFVLSIVLVMALTFAELYTMSVTIPRDFPEIYGFSTSQAGFVQLAAGVAMLAGTLFSGKYSDWKYRVWKARRNGVAVPEDRLRATFPSIFILVIGSLILGWSLVTAVSWILSAFGALVTGFGIMTFSTAGSAYLISLFPGSASSIIASANVLRYALAGLCGPLIVAPLQDAVGPGWVWTILAGLNCVAYGGMAWTAVKGARYRLVREPWRSGEGAEEMRAAIGMRESALEGMDGGKSAAEEKAEI
jgi:MFS family permease